MASHNPDAVTSSIYQPSFYLRTFLPFPESAPVLVRPAFLGFLLHAAELNSLTSIPYRSLTPKPLQHGFYPQKPIKHLTEVTSGFHT